MDNCKIAQRERQTDRERERERESSHIRQYLDRTKNIRLHFSRHSANGCHMDLRARCTCDPQGIMSTHNAPAPRESKEWLVLFV